MAGRGIAALARASSKPVRTGPRKLAAFALLGGALLLGCTPRSQPSASEDQPEAKPKPPACPTKPIPVERARDVRPEHERAEFWLAKLEPGVADEPLLDASEHAYLADRVSAVPGGWRDPVGDAMSPELIDTELRERVTFLRERVATGKYVEGRDRALDEAIQTIEAAKSTLAPNIHFVIDETPLWCVPTTAGLYTTPVDRDFDRNRCASLHPGEYVRALRASDSREWIYVNAGHSVGWVHQPGKTLEPAQSDEAARERLARPRVFLSTDVDGLRHGSSFPLVARDEERVTILVPSSEGPVERSIPAKLASAEPWALTRRKLFTQAFAQLEQPYGWGGRAGHRDCSRYLLDLFALFDVRLARNSSVQAELGTRSVDVSELDDEAKREAIREAAQTGVVLLYMPGHIMLYLGQDGGHDYGISALSEYLEPCPGGADTVYKLDEVAVTTLEVGRGTERRAFIERISKIAVFGPPPE